MINEHIEYINKLGEYKILEIMKQNNGLYFMAILHRGEVISFEKNCTKQRVQEFRNKILNNEKILALDRRAFSFRLHFFRLGSVYYRIRRKALCQVKAATTF